MTGQPSERFDMPIEAVFSVARRGLFASGEIRSGTVRAGDELLLVDGDRALIRLKCWTVEYVRTVPPRPVVALGLEGVGADDVRPGMKLIDVAQAN